MAKQKITREIAIRTIASMVRDSANPVSWIKIACEIDTKYIVRKNGWKLVRNALWELRDGNVIDRTDDVFREEYVVSKAIKHEPSIELIEERLELLGSDHPLVDQIEERISEFEFADGYCDHEELMQMNNQITNAIKELNR